MSKAAGGGLAWMFALMLVIGACAGTPASTPAQPAAAPDQPTGVPDATAAMPTVDDSSDGERGSAGGSATVTIGGQTYELFTAEPPLCSLGMGVQASMASADKQASIDVYTVGSTGPINFARIIEGEYWTPSGGQEAFVVSGSTATWSGAMSNRYGDGQQHVTITITCEGGA